jgi:DNA-binding FadR family transcriptional regulator
MNVTYPHLGSAYRARSAHDLVTHGIGRAIMDGQFAVGSTLPGDAELMERFGVSRTALREAMKTLAAKGLIESKTKVGTRVLGEKNWNMFDADILAWRLQLGVDRPFLESLFEVRQTLEPLAAASAALYRSEDDLRLMKAALDAMRRPHHTRDSFTRADVAYHRAILDASANPFLQSVGSVIEVALATAFTLTSPVDSPERFELSRQQHGAIFDAIARRDPQAASNAMSVVIVQGAKGAGIHRSDAPSVAITIKLFGN